MTQVMYLSSAPSLTIKLARKRWQAVNGVLTLPPEAAAELDQLMKTRPDISSLIKKVDLEEAARKAKEWVAKQPAAAVRGVVTSGTSAAAILREARQAQKTEILTGVENPINTDQKDSKPLQVTEVPTTAPKKSLLNRIK